MKLISKTIVLYLAISVPLLLIAGCISYIMIRAEVREGTDESLLEEMETTEQMISRSSVNCMVGDGMSTITEIAKPRWGFSFSDTVMFDKSESESIDYRLLKSYFNHNGKSYRIVIARPYLEEYELLEGLFSSFLVMIGFLILAFFAMNWFLSTTLWRPFYRTIDLLESYEVSKPAEKNFGSSSIEEFDKLNRALDKMTETIRNDFLRQKEFTENASHEMQTPLAVIKSKLELLMQSPKLGEEEMGRLQGVEAAVSKLASLNKALLLLARIDNGQFSEKQKVDMEQVVDRLLNNYADILSAREIKLSKLVKAPMHLEINPVLADILVGNLLQNAIRHNIDKGTILITVDKSSFSVANGGLPLAVGPAELFERFRKGNASTESLGLGLAIVKSITEYYGYSINYSYEDHLHKFTLTI